MRRYLVLALTIALVMVFVAPAASAKGPNEAISQNLDQNGAFSVCLGNRISNGHVVFGGRNAILTPGNGGLNADAGSAVGTQIPDKPKCGIVGGETQKVEPPGVFTGP